MENLRHFKWALFWTTIHNKDKVTSICLVADLGVVRGWKVEHFLLTSLMDDPLLHGWVFHSITTCISIILVELVDKVRLNGLWFVIHNEVFNFHNQTHQPFYDKVKNQRRYQWTDQRICGILIMGNFLHINMLKMIMFLNHVSFFYTDFFHIAYNKPT